MSGFQFPPPPPPPTSTRPDDQVGPRNQFGPRGGGRGRGRGRGTSDQSDRGTGSLAEGGHRHSYGPLQYQEYGHQMQLPASRGRGRVPEHSSRSDGPGSLRTGSSAYHALYPAPSVIPPGSYVNPAFVRPPTLHGTVYAHQDMASQHSGSFQTDEREHTTGEKCQTRNAHTNMPWKLQSERPSHTGHKRKLDALQGTRRQTQIRKPDGPPTTPSIPSFGGSILPDKAASVLDRSHAIVTRAQKPGRPQVNVLGLTPQDLTPHYSDSESDAEEENIDEEATLATALGSHLTFHDINGELRTLKSAADLLDWQRARKKNFPTKDHVSQKYAERRRMGAERRRLLIEARDALRTVMCDARVPSNKPSSLNSGKRASCATETDPDQRTKDRQRLETESVSSRAMLGERGQLSGPAKKLPDDIQPEALACDSKMHDQAYTEEHPQAYNTVGQQSLTPYTSATNEAERPATEGKTAEASTSRSITSTNAPVYLPESDSDNGTPEETTIKQRPKTETALTKCRYFAASGYCRDGSACRFKHEPSDAVRQGPKHITSDLRKRDPFAPVLDAPNGDGKKSIHQRLLEREQEGEDQLALQVIKYLAGTNFFSR